MSDLSVFVLQCVECNSIVADSSDLTAIDAVDENDVDGDDFRVRNLCHVRVEAKSNRSPKTKKANFAQKLVCAHCGSVVGRVPGESGLAAVNRVAVRRIELSSQRRAQRVPNESLERVVRAQQRLAKVKLLELSKKAAALDGRIATLDAQAAILRRRRDKNDSDDDQ
jgi:hypothetical protein